MSFRRPLSKRPAAPQIELPSRIESWEELKQIFDSGILRSWAFRGQPNAAWGLETSLARYFRKTGVTDPGIRMKQEERILRIFRRKAHLQLQHIPDERDAFEWLALMQHHGAPTRLLDFTWSPYVAAFYALATPTEAEEAAIWAVYPPALSPDRFGLWEFGNYHRHF
ncbi:MAG TPA: FRG domain-containing protein, partial [Longimicrobium sp.]|nr:FRG domain-containing protein [Longimicrobium sp.]